MAKQSYDFFNSNAGERKGMPNMVLPEVCQHSYQYQGRYGVRSKRPMAGTGAHNVDLVDVYYCSRCLDTQHRPTGICTDSYGYFGDYIKEK